MGASSNELPFVTDQASQSPTGAEGQTPAEIAASHARHYAALLAAEEPGTPGWQFVFGQLSAASALANALTCKRAGRREVS